MNPMQAPNVGPGGSDFRYAECKHIYEMVPGSKRKGLLARGTATWTEMCIRCGHTIGCSKEKRK